MTPKRSTLLISAAVLIAIGGGAWSLFHRADAVAASKEQAQQAPSISVTTVQVQERDIPLYLSGVGTVTANASVVVKVRIDGQLDKVGFTEGQDVKAGQLLAQIDPRALQAQLAQVQAQQARDQAQLTNAKIDLQRYTTLRQQDAATQQQLDTQKALVAQLEAAVKTDEAQISYAKVQLGYTTINAPISGRVGARLVDPGNIVHASDANGLVIINQIDPITVQFTLPEEAVPAINRAQLSSHKPLKVTAYARTSNEPLATGTLILLNNQIDTTSGTVQLKARFTNQQHTLWPGQYVNVNLQMDDHAPALTLPAAAIQRNQQGTYVYIVKADETVAIQPVKVTRIQDAIAVLSQGLEVNQRVVLDGQYKLKPGSHVIENKAAANGAGASAASAASAAPANAPANAPAAKGSAK
ncbi:efflux RND transporter periplasmic adaptor subunit [Herbaspirillum sp. 3R11]|nr:efflux RND transporter periplasmic adaptor subunit [Herbaspirillum sp. 3R-3a1]TFI07609.1 efflux RND transporter periplasmic adaptor subunit [Herbaspirillum sp. 3R11]TFI12348.1 efflux RND transporter periplasmic adaptor subunit [Herbaspirillum sp. 3R-11]TFI19630.1 efflux RND transporter periplasmic adaptor subunit [Herbaspirillum sp. 3C11]